jgi:hypothetical protein
MVSTLDFAETFLDAAGIAPPPDTQGRSLLPLLRGEACPSDWRKSFYYHYYEHPGPHNVRAHYGVVTDRYTLVHFYGDLDEWELFDREKDPQEMRSVYSDPKYEEKVRDLRSELGRLQKDLGDDSPEVPLPELLRRQWKRAAGAPELVFSLPAAKEGEWTSLDPSGKALSAGAWCTLRGSDGVLLSQGDGATGWALWVKDGRLHFGVRNAGTLKEVLSRERLPIGQAVHVAGVLSEEMTLRLYVDGTEVGRAWSHLLSGKPVAPLTVGRAGGSAVGDYDSPFRFDGELKDIRVYWGALDLPAVRAWAAK